MTTRTPGTQGRTITQLVETLREDLPMQASPLQWLRAHKTDVLELVQRWSSGRVALLCGISTVSLERWAAAVHAGRSLTEREFLAHCRGDHGPG